MLSAIYKTKKAQEDRSKRKRSNNCYVNKSHLKRRRMSSYDFHPSTASSNKAPKDMLSPILLGNQPISKHIVSYLEALSFTVLAQTSKSIRSHLHGERWDINRRLERFFEYPAAFRTALRDLHAIVAGDVALQLFQGTTRLDASLDIYVEKGGSARHFRSYLTHQEGYSLNESRSGNNGAESDIHKLKIYGRDRTKYGTTIVRLFETAGVPFQCVLNSSHTSTDVNIIAWNKAYSIFPFATFIQHKMYMLRPMDEAFGQVLKMHRNHGWKLEDIVRPNDMLPEMISSPDPPLPACMRLSRHLGDHNCWTVPFGDLLILNADRGDIDNLPDLQLNTFSISTLPELPPYISPCYPIHAKILKHDMLRFCYTYSHEDWWSAVLARLEDMLAFELVCIMPEDRPEKTLADTTSRSHPTQPGKKELLMHHFGCPNRGELGALSEAFEHADHLLHKWYTYFNAQRDHYDMSIEDGGELLYLQN